MGRGPSSLHRAGFLSTTVSSGLAGQVLSGASQPEQAFKAAQPSYREEPPKQRSTDGRLCDLCVTNEGELVETSGAWRQALWLAEKHIITRVQTMVQSPILARYAAAAYRLRQKPLGVCCLSCQQSVWESSVGPPSTGAFLKPVGPWPGAAEAAITGARFFPVDFGADEAAELCTAGRQNSKPRDGNPGATRTAGEVYQSQGRGERRSVTGAHQERLVSLVRHNSPGASGLPASEIGPAPRMDRGVRITLGTRYPWVLGGKQDSRMLGG